MNFLGDVFKERRAMTNLRRFCPTETHHEYPMQIMQCQEEGSTDRTLRLLEFGKVRVETAQKGRTCSK